MVSFIAKDWNQGVLQQVTSSLVFKTNVACDFYMQYFLWQNATNTFRHHFFKVLHGLKV